MLPATTSAAAMIRNRRTCESRTSAQRSPAAMRTYSTKGMPPAIMPQTAMASISGLLKWPSEASEVENPPVAIVVMAWLTASNALMPAAQ